MKKKIQKPLTLRRETLLAIVKPELHAVRGGSIDSCGSPFMEHHCCQNGTSTTTQ